MITSVSDSPLVSLIILNHNGWTQNREMFKECLRNALSVNSVNKEVILVDNGSTDGSQKFVQEMFPTGIKHVTLRQNVGYSSGMNAGAEYSSTNSKYLFFINNDVSFSEEAVKGLLRLLEANPSIAVAGCGIWHRDRIYVGSFFDIRLTHHTPKVQKHPYYVTVVENFIAVRADVFRRLGGFEPNIFQVYDEADLCLRAWFSGNKVACDPRILVYHRHRLPNKRNITRVFRFMRNKYLIMLKFYDLRYLAVYFPLKILTDTWWSISNPRWRRRRSIIMVFKSLMDIIFGLKVYYQRRLIVLSLKKVSLSELIKKGILNL